MIKRAQGGMYDLKTNHNLLEERASSQASG
jgi:hypothetical protein